MKEYKILKAGNKKKAEELMNQMSQEGWEVVSTCPCRGLLSLKILITFAHEAK